MVKTGLPSGSDRVTPKRLTIFSRAGFCIGKFAYKVSRRITKDFRGSFFVILRVTLWMVQNDETADVSSS
jgi:hypothetical protein